MNTLSWLIYLADVAGDLDGLLYFVSVISVLCVFCWVGVAVVLGEEKPKTEAWKAWGRVGFYAIAPIFFLSWIFSAFVPAKETVYAIAASELGESALKSETASKAFKALNAWLDRQIAGTEEEASNEEEK